jgi:hypothetical protein
MVGAGKGRMGSDCSTFCPENPRVPSYAPATVVEQLPWLMKQFHRSGSGQVDLYLCQPISHEESEISAYVIGSEKVTSDQL